MYWFNYEINDYFFFKKERKFINLLEIMYIKSYFLVLEDFV